MNLTKQEKEQTLKNFMKEFFPFKEMVNIGFFKKEWKGDYHRQAEKVCNFFGYKTVYEYGTKEARVHISFAGERPKGFENMITEYKNIYKS